MPDSNSFLYITPWFTIIQQSIFSPFLGHKLQWTSWAPFWVVARRGCLVVYEKRYRRKEKCEKEKGKKMWKWNPFMLRECLKSCPFCVINKQVLFYYFIIYYYFYYYFIFFEDRYVTIKRFLDLDGGEVDFWRYVVPRKQLMRASLHSKLLALNNTQNYLHQITTTSCR